MKTLINTLTTDKAAQVTGKIVNAIIFISGLTIVALGIAAQFIDKLNGFNLFTDLF